MRHRPATATITAQNDPMPSVVFLRGVNVGGHRTFRPSLVAQHLAHHGAINVGAAGTFVIGTPGPRFKADLRRSLPFQTEIIMVDASEIQALVAQQPLPDAPPPDTVPFVAILPNPADPGTDLPISLPPDGEWLVRLIDTRQHFVLGLYRRHMKTIGQLGKIDHVFGVKVTTRTWNTILRIGEILA
jgi:uncharacterized protein (DUF1697 family)